MVTPTFQSLLEKFFVVWLGRDRSVSANTVCAYRDAFKLLVTWFRDERGVAAADLALDHLTRESIQEFLAWLATSRGNCAKTVNCRLAALRSFCSFALYEVPDRSAQLSAVSSIPERRAQRREVDWLAPDEVGLMVSLLGGRPRDRLLVLLLYNTGCRVSEAVGLKGSDVRVKPGGRCDVHVVGKGRKERTLPLWDDTSSLLRAHMSDNGVGPGDYVFAGRGTEHMTRSGARSVVERAFRLACAAEPSLSSKKCSPHVFRHSTAMAMLAAGVDIATVAIWLGHESVNTTHRYVVSDMRLKEEALEKVRRSWEVEPRKPYKANPDVLDFLMSL